MEIEQLRVTLRTRDLERSRQFYGKTLSLPEVGAWEGEGVRGVLYQAGPGQIEVLGRVPGAPRRAEDDAFEYRGPEHEMELVLLVPSPERVYEELIFRDRNVPGGLRQEDDGSTRFETQDPDGIKIVFRRAAQ
ncbi:MAG TPA: VOC family protein [Thermoanaerobaculia bacterium]|nr:VOC family protein [Thermoanaerobaculia bacterium]